MMLIAFTVLTTTPVALFAAQKWGLVSRRLYEILQGLYCLVVAGLLIAFGIAYFVETGGIFKPLRRPEGSVRIAFLSEDPLSFFVACAVLLFFCSFLLVGAWKLLRGKWASKRAS